MPKMPNVHTNPAPLRRATAAEPTHPLLQARADIQEAEQLRKARQFELAQKKCEAVLKRYPDYAAALHTIGLILFDQKEDRRALGYLVGAAMFNPRSTPTLVVLSRVYLRLGANVMARATLEQARKLSPDDANVLATLADIYREDKEYEAAAEAYREALKAKPDHANVPWGLGDACAQLGQLKEAAAAFEQALVNQPTSVGTLYSLAELPPTLVNVDLGTLVEKATRRPDETFEHFESSRSFVEARVKDKSGRYDEAWDALIKANRAPARENKDKNLRGADLRKRLLAAATAGGHEPRLPIDRDQPISLFILGPSRAGKTTAEHLVGTIDGVKRGYENPIVQNAVGHSFQRAVLPTRRWLMELPQELDSVFTEFYLEELRERAGQASVFTNTVPGHISSVLRFADTVPNMRLLLLKRDVDDLTFRILMKHYQKDSNSYAYTIKSIRSFIEWYYLMIDVLAEKLSGISKVVRYEEMIDNPNSFRKSVAELCGLPEPRAPLPTLGDDRDCSAPYRTRINAALGL